MELIKQLFTQKLFLLQTAFLISLVAVLSSLGLSEIAGLPPCELCWYQRILMYPMPFILGAALAQKTYDVFWYAFPMAVLGAGIALYHYVIQMSAFAASSCSAELVACTTRQIEYFGFITIPFGSSVSFLVLAAILLLLQKQHKKH